MAGPTASSTTQLDTADPAMCATTAPHTAGSADLGGGYRMYRRLLITGSQLWTDTTVIRDALAQVWHPDTILMSGACPRGADRLCEDCWTHWGGRVDRFPARWTVDGHYRRDAGFRRNEEMVATAADLCAERCLAFVLDESPGSTHTIGLARAAGIRTTVYRATTGLVADSADLWQQVPGGF